MTNEPTSGRGDGTARRATAGVLSWGLTCAAAVAIAWFAFDWLRQNNLDDIIKNDVVVSFGKGEDNVAGHCVGLLEEQGFTPETKTYVHPSTLKAFVKERIQSGKPIDLDMFGAFVSNVAEIKRRT